MANMVKRAMYFTGVFIGTLLIAVSCKQTIPPVESPDGKIQFFIQHDENENSDKCLFYHVTIHGNGKKTDVIEPSPLGLERDDQSFYQNLTFQTATKVKNIHEQYSLRSGKSTQIAYEANEVSYTFVNEQNSEIIIQARVFNTGIAFRYIFPGEGNEKRTVRKEYTGFNLPEEGKVWITPYDKAAPWSPGYERYFTNGTKIGQQAPEKQGWAFPCLFNTNEYWLLISESNLSENYVASHLQPEAPKGLYTIRFPEKDERYNEGDRYATSTLPWKMPWRCIIISDTLSDIVESNMVTHLSKPSKEKDVSWIIPGKASWGWWSSTSGRTVKRLKKYIDLADTMGWKYSLVDAGWENMPDGNISEVIDYAGEKNIGIWLWYNSGGRRENNFSRDTFILENPVLRKKEMKKLAEWGIKGIKVDFFNSDKQHVIKLYHDILKDAIRYHLLVNFHGCTLPRGWRRTYPNLLTMEAIRGGESYRFAKDFPDNAPVINTIAVFTRNVFGPMDYTPCTFSDNKYPHITTYGHELALSVIFESGIVHMADRASAYLNLQDMAKQFLKDVPVVWDETKYLDGFPGELAILARKKDDTWYLAGINSLDKKVTKNISLFFLSDDKEYIMTLKKDGESPDQFNTLQTSISSQESIQVTMLPFGGFACVFRE
jgi:alpha-glucosidase